MTREQLEHIIRASGAIADVSDIVVIGSQAVLGEFPDAPPEILISNEADVFPRDHPERSDMIDGTIGDGSPFLKSFGYYAHGIGESTAVLPAGWRERLVLVSGENTRFVRGWCLEIHDLTIAKYAAGREKDLDFTAVVVRHAMVNRATLAERLAVTPVDPQARVRIAQRIENDFAKTRS